MTRNRKPATYSGQAVGGFCEGYEVKLINRSRSSRFDELQLLRLSDKMNKVLAAR